MGGLCCSNSFGKAEETEHIWEERLIQKPKFNRVKAITIYTDGGFWLDKRSAICGSEAARKLNFGVRLVYYDNVLQDNNRAEMYAAICALKQLLGWCKWPRSRHQPIEISTDSLLLVNMLKKVINGQQLQPEFAEVFEELKHLSMKSPMGIQFRHVPCHQVFGNREANKLVTDSIVRDIIFRKDKNVMKCELD